MLKTIKVDWKNVRKFLFKTIFSDTWKVLCEQVDFQVYNLQ